MAKWDRWNASTCPRLWQCISLSLGREPREMMGQYGERALLQWVAPHDQSPEYTEYLERAQQFLDHVGWSAENARFKPHRQRAMETAVPVVAVARLARVCCWTAPKEFLALADAAPPSSEGSPPAPATSNGGRSAPTRWTTEALKELRDFQKEHGTKKAAEHFKVSRQLVEGKLKDKAKSTKAAFPGFPPTTE